MDQVHHPSSLSMGTCIHSLSLVISLCFQDQQKRKGSIGGNNSMDLLLIARGLRP
jgi:hypothetical protein